MGGRAPTIGRSEVSPIDPLRLSGLGSGLDTDTMIQKLMTLERQPISRVDQQSGRLSAQKTGWADLGASINALKASADSLALATTWTVQAATPSDSTLLTATAGGSAAAGVHSLVITTLAKPEVVQSGTFGSTTGALGYQGTVTFGSKSVTVATGDSLDGLRDKINAAGAGLSASVLEVSSGAYALVLQSTQSGTAGAVAFSDDATNTPLVQLGLLTAGNAKHVAQAAVNAEFTVDGVAFTRDRNTISDAIPGVSLTLRGGGPVQLSVSNDTATMAARVNDFAARFNALVDKIKRLTDKGGVLGADTAATALRSRLVTLVMSNVRGLPSTLQNLSQLGGTVDRDGHLSFDGVRLSAQLNADPAAAAAIFTTAGNGLGPALGSLLIGYTGAGGILGSQNQAFDRRLQDLQRTRATLQRIASQREDNLRRDFAAMDKAITTMRSQGSWISMQLTGTQAKG